METLVNNDNVLVFRHDVFSHDGDDDDASCHDYAHGDARDGDDDPHNAYFHIPYENVELTYYIHHTLHILHSFHKMNYEYNLYYINLYFLILSSLPFSYNYFFILQFFILFYIYIFIICSA